MTATIRCLAIDDEPIALEKLKMYIEKTPFLELVRACEDAVEAMDVMNTCKVDAVFIDINMPDLNGLDFMMSIPEDERPLIVFTTAYSRYAVESFRVAPVDYLLKPFSFAEFQRAAARVLRQFGQKTELQAGGQAAAASLYVKVGYDYVRIAPADIRYIEGMSDYLRIYLTSEKTPLTTLSTFRQIRELLPPSFLQVHRSFIVNMDRAQKIARLRIQMDEDTLIPVGDAYKEAFFAYLQQHAIGRK